MAAKGRSKEPGVSLATLDAARLAAGLVAIVAPVLGIGFGLYFALRRTLVFTAKVDVENGDDYFFANDFAVVHSTLVLGIVVIVFGLLLGAAAAALAVGLHDQVAPRLHAQRLAAAREIADEPF